MTKGVKIGIGVGILGAGVGAYFLIKYLKLRKAYNTTMNTQDAAILVQQETQDVGDQIIPDEVTNNADQLKGTEVDENQTSLQEFDVLSGYGDY